MCTIGRNMMQDMVIGAFGIFAFKVLNASKGELPPQNVNFISIYCL